MRTARVCTFVVAAGLAVAGPTALAQPSPQSTFEIRKLPTAVPTGPPAFTSTERTLGPTAALTPAEKSAVLAEMVKGLGVALLPPDQPFRISISQTHPHAAFYARLCNAKSLMEGAPSSWVSMSRPSPGPGLIDWNNASLVAAIHEAKPGYAYYVDFELRNFPGGNPGPIAFKVQLHHYNPTTYSYIPMNPVAIRYSTPSNHLVIPYMAGFQGHIAVVIQPIGPPANVKGVNSALITPVRTQ